MFAHLLVCWGKAQQSCAPAGEESNKYDLIAAPYFRLANHNDWSRWFAVSSLPRTCSFTVLLVELKEK
jgi:hypothetical protein